MVVALALSYPTEEAGLVSIHGTDVSEAREGGQVDSLEGCRKACPGEGRGHFRCWDGPLLARIIISDAVLDFRERGEEGRRRGRR